VIEGWWRQAESSRDTERSRVIPVLMHGDAAFTGRHRFGDPRALGARGLPDRRDHPHHRQLTRSFHDVARDYRFTPIRAMSRRSSRPRSFT